MIVLAILGSMPVNAKEVLQNENEAWDIEKGNARTILIITKDVWSPSDRVCVRATLQIQDSYSQIVGISNVEICGSLATGVSNMKASTPKICADGSYATVEVTYKYKGKNYHEISKDFFVLLGLEQIPSNEVVILPSLLNYGCKKIS